MRGSVSALPLVGALLSSIVRAPAPWLNMEAGSEQRPPAYLGLRPLDLSLGVPPEAHPVLPENMRELGEKEIQELRKSLPPGSLELEGWPSPDDYGQWTWVFARWRAPGGSWKWLDSPVFHPWIDKERAAIFDDFLRLPSLYDKPVFGDCVWTDEKGSRILGAWLPTARRSDYESEVLARIKSGERPVCRLIPQPSRWNGKPRTFVVSMDAEGKVLWPAELEWRADAKTGWNAEEPPTREIRAWPEDFKRSYREDILALDGEAEALFPKSGKKMRFIRKNSSDPRHQLEDVADYLGERYRELGLRTRRQRFTWRGIPQSNLIAIIPGSNRGKANRPVLLADHYDTAYAEDVFESTGARVSAPGADDNATGTAALLRAAEVLRNLHPKNDIWLVHLTGEEFPGDDLGARRFLEGLLRERREISGLVLLDMIGHRSPGDGVFQINPGASPGSSEFAKLALQLAPGLVDKEMEPVLRPPQDERSYLYNTDGLLFSDAGYPVVLLNEHINRLENYGRPGHHRPGYHRTDDTSSGVDFSYAAAIAKLAIETTAQLARRR